MEPNQEPTFEELKKEISKLRIQSELALNGKAEAKKASEKRITFLSNVLDSIGDPIFVKDDQSKLLHVNDAFCKVFGLSREEIIGKTLAEDVSPEEHESFLKIDEEVLSTGEENINEETLTVRDGEVLQISTRKSRLVDAEGNKFLVGIIHDITKRHRAESELQIAYAQAEDYQERFRLLTLNMDAGVVIHAPDTSILVNNLRASEILGLSDDQLKGKIAIDPDWKFVYPDQSPLPIDEYPVNRIAAGELAIKDLRVGIYQPGKEDIVWLTVNGFAVLNQAKEITEIVTVFVDITEQKRQKQERLRARLELEKTEKQLNEAQKLAGVGSWIFNPFTDDVLWSEEMFNIWGFDSKRGTPRYDPSILKRIHPDDVRLSIRSMDRAIKDGVSYDIEFRVCLPDGEQKVVRSICEPELGDLGEVIRLTGTNQDITVQKLFEEAQVKHQRLKAIGEMSSSIAHDFNNALQELMGNLEVIKFQEKLSADTRERLDAMSAIIADTAGRVSALQKFGDSKNDDAISGLVDLNQLIIECLEQSRPLWKDWKEKEGLRVEIKTDLHDIPKIRCNAGELKSAVYNLMKNSIEAMPEGGNLNIKTGVQEGQVFATFTDTGLGMNEETKLKIFEPFFTTKGFELGRGLGMSGSYNVVKKIGGDIIVKKSEPNKGTTIQVTMPFADQIFKETDEPQEPQKVKPLNTLWVDDDFIITKSSGKMMESLGHKCTTVNSGKKALEYLEQNDCDVIFTDIGMPKMNGWELAKAIREKYGSDMKIIAVTGWNMREQVEKESTVDLFLQKPFTLADLKTTLAELSGYFDRIKTEAK